MKLGHVDLVSRVITL